MLLWWSRLLGSRLLRSHLLGSRLLCGRLLCGHMLYQLAEILDTVPREGLESEEIVSSSEKIHAVVELQLESCPLRKRLGQVLAIEIAGIVSHVDELEQAHHQVPLLIRQVDEQHGGILVASFSEKKKHRFGGAEKNVKPFTHLYVVSHERGHLWHSRRDSDVVGSEDESWLQNDRDIAPYSGQGKTRTISCQCSIDILARGSDAHDHITGPRLLMGSMIYL